MRTLKTTDTRRIVVSEQAASGHRLDYVSILSSKASENGLATILLTSPEAQSSPEFARLLGRPAHFQPSEIHANLSFSSTPDSQFKSTITSLRCAKRHTATLIIPNVDEKLVPLLLLRPLFPRQSVRGIVMRRPGAEDHSFSATIKKLLIGLLRRANVELHTLVSPFDPSVSGWDLVDPSGLIPLTVDDKTASNASSEFSTWKNTDPRPVVGIIGVLNDRKSVLECIDALKFGGNRKLFRLLIAGMPSSPHFADEIKARAAGISNDDLLMVARGLSDEELELALDATDILALMYTNEAGSSGLLTHGLSRGLRIVGLHNIAVNRAIDMYKVGSIAEDTQPESISSAIASAKTNDLAGNSAFPDVRLLCESQWSQLATA